MADRQNMNLKNIERPSTTNSRVNIFKKVMSYPEAGAVIPLIVLVAITGILRPNFFAPINIAAIFGSIGFIGIITIGQSLVVMSGEIDISVASIAALGSALVATFMINGIPVLLSALLAVFGCGAIGFINGFLVTRVKLHAFIATIAMFHMGRGAVDFITKGYSIWPLPEAFNNFGDLRPFGIPIAFIITLILMFFFHIILKKTVYGRNIYAVGNNKIVAEISGINVKNIKHSAFILSAMLAGIAGILLTAKVHACPGMQGGGAELQSIAACALGGISLSGGVGTMLGTLIGTSIFVTITNSLILLGIKVEYQNLIVGIILIGAVYMDMIKRSRKIKS